MVAFKYSVEGKRLQLLIAKIPVSDILREKNRYTVAITTKKVNLNIEFSVKLFKKYKEKGITGNCFSFRKDKGNDCYRLSLKIGIDSILKFTKNNRFQIKRNWSKGIKVNGSLLIDTNELKVKLHANKNRNKKKDKCPGDKVRDDQHIQYLVEKINLYEQKYKNREPEKNDIVDENVLEKKKIHLREIDSFVRCENCVYNMRYKCTYHNVKVTNNHGCYYFRRYKIVYGGGFSPK